MTLNVTFEVVLTILVRRAAITDDLTGSAVAE